MSHRIYATFANRDLAQLAAARLKRKGASFRFAVRDTYDPNLSDVRAAPASMSLLFPYQPPNWAANHTNTSNPQSIGRALFTSDTLGLPIYAGASETEVCITVDDETLEDARALLYNCGAYNVHS